MIGVMFLHLSVQEDDIVEHTNAKCHLSRLIHMHTPHNIIEHACAKIPVSTLECQVS